MDNRKNILKTVSIMIISIMTSLIFKYIGLKEANIILVFTVGIMIISKYTDGYIYGVVASVVGVLCYNFLFTKPYYTFQIEDPGYIITVIIMLVATLITSTSTSKVKEEAKEYLKKEQRIRILYENNKKLLNAKSRQEIVQCCTDSIGPMLNRNTFMVINTKSVGPIEYEFNKDNHLGNMLKLKVEQSILKQYLYLNKIDKETTKLNNEKNIKYYPIQGKKHTLGVLCVEEVIDNKILESEEIMINSILSQVTLAIEKENLYEKNRLNSIRVNRERIKGDLLRSISHDLRTPLASILGSSSTIIENYDKIDDNLKKELLDNIYEDCNWLTRTVENILSITRMDEGKLEIKKSMEVAEEIVSDALKITNHFSSDRIIKVSLPEEIVVINVDGLLIRQVLVNLIDNAKRHTTEGCEIKVSICKNIKNTTFKVSDNGEGLQTDDVDNIFERFYSKSEGKKLEQRGIGLGLAICKSIVVAHGGEIIAYNNSNGGATFEFKIPNS